MGNAFSFDDSEFAEQPENEESQQDAADAALESLEQSPAAVEEDPALQDVDLRLEIADYYRAILKHPFFDTSVAAAKLVDSEIRGFIRERLEVLLGLRSPRESTEPVFQFTEEEAKALKIIAAKVNGKPSLVTGGPSVNKMPTPTAKKPTTPVVRPKPAVRKIPAPPPAPSTKPAPKPAVAKKPEAPKKPEAKPQTKPAAKKPEPKPTGDAQTYINTAGQTVTLVEGEVIEENGRKYKVVRNEAGTLFRRDITGQVVAPGRIPPMSVQQMSIMSQQQAEAQLAALDETTGIAIVASLTKQE